MAQFMKYAYNDDTRSSSHIPHQEQHGNHQKEREIRFYLRKLIGYGSMK